jgi:hypothetical protein
MNLRLAPPIFHIWPNNISFKISYLLFFKPHPKTWNWGCKRLESIGSKPLGLISWWIKDYMLDYIMDFASFIILSLILGNFYAILNKYAVFA